MPDYQTQLSAKCARINTQFARFSPPAMSIYPSPKWHFRQRVEFRIWHDDDDLFYAMFKAGEKPSQATLKRVEQLPIASQHINALMPELIREIKANDCLRTRLYGVEFLSTLASDTLVTLIYHKPLDAEWQEFAKSLAERLSIDLVGRSRGQKVVLTKDYVTEKLNVHGQLFSYLQIEGGFTQPNAVVCQSMLEWACDCAQSINSSNQNDLLELYCGNANFTLPLSTHFRQVLATEVAKTSVKAARENIAKNNCDNIAIARLSAEELTVAMNGERIFKRLEQDKINLDTYEFSTIFVDPPRAGVDDNTLKMMQDFEHILYISCQPDTLYANLETLIKTHDINRIALFDQFPYTHHVEMGVWLTHKN